MGPDRGEGGGGGGAKKGRKGKKRGEKGQRGEGMERTDGEERGRIKVGERKERQACRKQFKTSQAMGVAMDITLFMHLTKF